ncbi:hypothetical protein HAP94_13955 [Acidithiobacillus ferrivorans]|nr:hypothetical protein [Acidithiobacillus ferrivorans]
MGMFSSDGNDNSSVTRKVISTLRSDGTDIMGLDTIAWKFPDQSIVSGSVITVESNHFAILKTRGAVLAAYETGQYPVETPDKPLFGVLTKSLFGGASPWQYETIFIQRSKLLVGNSGVATSLEMAEMTYRVDYYVHVDSTDDAVKLITHMPFSGESISKDELAQYAGPVAEQAINQIVQVTPMENINEHIHEISALIKKDLGEFLAVYGITLNDVKLSILPKDERMREIISLRALGLSGIEAVRFYLALKMADKGLVSAPNAAVGEGFTIGGATMGTYPVSNINKVGA